MQFKKVLKPLYILFSFYVTVRQRHQALVFIIHNNRVKFIWEIQLWAVTNTDSQAISWNIAVIVRNQTHQKVCQLHSAYKKTFFPGPPQGGLVFYKDGTCTSERSNLIELWLLILNETVTEIVDLEAHSVPVNNSGCFHQRVTSVRLSDIYRSWVLHAASTVTQAHQPREKLLSCCWTQPYCQ